MEKGSRDIILWFFLALLLVSLFMLGRLIWPFVSIIIVAAVVTSIFSPVYRMFSKKTKMSVASFLTCVLIFFILFIPILFFVGILSKEAYDFYLMAKTAVLSDQIKELMSRSMILEKINAALSYFNMEVTGEEFNKTVSEAGKIVGLFLYEQASLIASNIFKFLINFFLMLIVIYFLLIDGERLVSFIVDLSPLPREQDEKLIQKFKDIAGAIMIGNGLGGLVQGAAGGFIFMFFGLKSPFLWGVIMALLAFLPIVGIGAVFIPASAVLIIKGRIAAGVFFILFYLILSGSIEYIFKPKLVGARVKMHTLLVFLSIIGGLNLFGILGIVYGPLVAAGFLTLVDIYNANYQKFVEVDKEENVL